MYIVFLLLPPSIAIISSPTEGISVTKKGKYRTPKANLQTLVKKSNNIRNRGTPLVIFHESLDPPPPHPLRILAKTSGIPSPGFSTFVHLCLN